MKKLISIILMLTLVCSILTTPTFAQTTNSKISDHLLKTMEYWNDDELNKVSVEFNIEFDSTVYNEPINEYYREKIGTILENYGIKESRIANAISEQNYAVWLNKSDVLNITESEYIVFVDEGNKTPVPAADHIYEDVFLNSVRVENSIYTYDEAEYHYDTNNNIDWVLILGISCYSEPMQTYAVIGDRVAVYSGYNYPTTFYWVYDVNKKQFFDICNIDWSEYEGLDETIHEQEIGIPIGDADFDGVLSVMDSTFIQCVLANLCQFYSNDDLLSHKKMTDTVSLSYVSDMDRDGSRTILDATAIQLKLARIE